MTSTLVVFARAPIPGFCKTRLAKSIGDDAAARLYEAMLRDTVQSVSAMRNVDKVLFAAPEHDGARVLRTYVSADWKVEPQPPGDLTARLAHAFSLADNVACIGTDAPCSPFAELEAALQCWTTDVIMGPAHDGGYWCIGMRRANHALLEGMPWSTNTVASESLARSKRLGLSVATLPWTIDVDEAADITQLRAELADARAPHTARALLELRL